MHVSAGGERSVWTNRSTNAEANNIGHDRTSHDTIMTSPWGKPPLKVGYRLPWQMPSMQEAIPMDLPSRLHRDRASFPVRAAEVGYLTMSKRQGGRGTARPRTLSMLGEAVGHAPYIKPQASGECLAFERNCLSARYGIPSHPPPKPSLSHANIRERLQENSYYLKPLPRRALGLTPNLRRIALLNAPSDA